MPETHRDFLWHLLPVCENIESHCYNAYTDWSLQYAPAKSLPHKRSVHWLSTDSAGTSDFLLIKQRIPAVFRKIFLKLPDHIFTDLIAVLTDGRPYSRINILRAGPIMLLKFFYRNRPDSCRSTSPSGMRKAHCLMDRICKIKRHTVRIKVASTRPGTLVIIPSTSV